MGCYDSIQEIYNSAAGYNQVVETEGYFLY